MISRRTLLRTAFSATAFGAGTGFYTWQIEPHWLEIVRRPLRIAGLPDSLVGRTLVQLSDIHIGPQVDDRYVLQTFKRVILSGHTHGGQCKPPFLPPPLLPVTNRRYAAGEYRLKGGRRMYISRGVGHLAHVRFNVRPEVTVFELEREVA